MNEIGLERFERIREALRGVETAEFSAEIFGGMNPEHQAEVKTWADAQWAALGREHMRWLMLTVAVEQGRADYYKAKLDDIEAEKRVRQAKFAEMREAAEAVGDEQ